MSEISNTIRIGIYSVDFNQILGKGATGYVYRGFNIETYEPVAVKAIQMSQVNNQVTQYLLQGEKKAMNTIKSPYTIKTYEIIQQKDYCYIVMELCSNGTLKQYINKKNKLESKQSLQLIYKIIIGYTSIIDSLFIHRDLKTANILLRQNNQPVIIDFGYCEMIMGKRPLIAYNVGSPSYMSPQAYLKNRYSQKSDIWALGIILYQMLTGKTLDNGLNIKEYFKNIQNQGKVNINLQLHNNINNNNNRQNIPQVCIDILQNSLQVDPQKRATIHKLKYIIDKFMIPQMQAQLKKAYSCNQPIINSNSNSNNNKSGSSQQLRFIPPAYFNYASNKNIDIKQKNNQKFIEKQKQKIKFNNLSSNNNKQQSNKEKKDKIIQNLKYLRNSDQFQFQNIKFSPPTTPTYTSNIINTNTNTSHNNNNNNSNNPHNSYNSHNSSHNNNNNQINYNSSNPSTPISSQQRNQQSLMFLQNPTQNIPPQVHPILRKSLQRNTAPKNMIKKVTSFKQVQMKLNTYNNNNLHNNLNINGNNINTFNSNSNINSNFNNNHHNHNFKRVPILQKANSLQQTMSNNYGNRGNVVSLRII